MKSGATAWSWDECYLAVWIYDVLDRSACPGTKVSLYRQIAELTGRSAKSVEFKVQNVAAIDIREDNQKPISSLDHVQKLLIKVFDWYWEDRTSSRELYDLVAMRIRMKKGNNLDCLQSESHLEDAVAEIQPHYQAGTPKQ